MSHGQAWRAFAIAVMAHAASFAASAKGIDMSSLQSSHCAGLIGEQTFDARCGFLTLPERADGTGRRIKIAVAVLMPANKAFADRVPTVLVHGGPGVGLVNSLWWLTTSAFAKRGPLIVFDHRGVGASTPHLCEFLDRYDPALDAMTVAQSESYWTGTIKRCIAELDSQCPFGELLNHMNHL